MSDKWLEDPSTHNLDCGDNSCKYRDTPKLGGMRTNGGCRCAENKGRNVERFLLRNYFKAQAKIQELETTLEIDKLLRSK